MCPRGPSVSPRLQCVPGALDQCVITARLPSDCTTQAGCVTLVVEGTFLCLVVAFFFPIIFSGGN